MIKNTLALLLFVVMIEGCATTTYSIDIPGNTDIDRVFVSDGNNSSLLAAETNGNVVLKGPKVEVLMAFLSGINNNFQEPWSTLPRPKYTIEIVTNSGKRSFLFVSSNAISGRIYNKDNRLLRVTRLMTADEAKQLESLAFGE